MTPIVNAMTVDVEDYFQVSAFASVVSRDRWDGYESRVAKNTDRLLALFSEAGVHATFFVLGWVAERDPALVRRIAAAGHEIASHGYGHRLVYDQRPEEFREDVRRSKAMLEAVCGRPVLGYRAPSFSITNTCLWALDVLVEEGFAWDASIFPIRHDRYGIPSAPRHPFRVGYGSSNMIDVGWGFPGLSEVEGSPGAPDAEAQHGIGVDPPPWTGDGLGLLEIPASTARVAGVNLPVGGGGYFRLLPYAWTRWGIRRVNAVERKPVVFYLHPWEIDPEQPRFAAPWLSRLRHYRNLHRTEARLRRLLSEFSFDTVSSAIPVPAAGAAPRVHHQHGCEARAT